MKLSKSQIETITKLLKEGKPLPEDYKNIFFPVTKKEYELVYAEKEREEDVLAETMAVPLQPVKTFGENGKDWTNKLIFGDNIQILKALLNNSEIKGKVKLVYIDPPFGTGDEYSINKGASAYSAKLMGAKFIEFLRKRLIFLREILAHDGSIYVRIDYHFGHYIKAIMDEVFGPENFQNEIIINRFKRQLSDISRYNVATDQLFYYTLSSGATFNQQDRKRICTFCGKETEPQWRGMSSPGLRNPPERVIFGKKLLPPKGRHWTFTQDKVNQMKKDERIRINESITYTDLNGNKIKGLPEYLQTENTPVDSNWTDLKGYVFGARYPTENPEELLQRVVLASSNPGDLIMDCFAGSGTTLAVAEKYGRRWIGVDCGKLAIYTIQKRMLRISESANLENLKEKYGKACAPFTLYNAGLYDYQKVKELSWEEYRNFALRLFQCRDEKHTIAKIELDGYLGSSDVVVFNYQKHKDVVLDRGFIDDLHSALGDRISDKFFIISPAANVKFLEDYIEKNKIKYYILRIPYSIINELHQKDFQAIRQPVDEMDVNDTVEAVGFDFIQIPNVECEYFIEKTKKKGLFAKEKECVIKIKKFESQIISKKPLEFKNRETLSMIMLDYDYDGKVFDIDDVFYAESLQNESFEVRFDKDKIKDEMMIIYVDIFGNEKREMKKLTDFKIKK